MAKYVTIGYGDREGYDRTDARALALAHAGDARLRGAGAVLGVAGAPVQVRNHGGEGTVVRPGAFLSSDLPVAGFAVVDADDLDHAVRIASQAPCAVAYGVVEVWPLHEVPGTVPERRAGSADR